MTTGAERAAECPKDDSAAGCGRHHPARRLPKHWCWETTAHPNLLAPLEEATEHALVMGTVQPRPGATEVGRPLRMWAPDAQYKQAAEQA